MKNDASGIYADFQLGLAVIIDSRDNLQRLFADGGLRRAVSMESAAIAEPIENYIVHDPAIISADAMLVEAKGIMLKKKNRCLIVTEVRKSSPIHIIEIFDR
jgi:signal-transduction protein with cAMP-binding, CBS, and nucleotidyltransferase domain